MMLKCVKSNGWWGTWNSKMLNSLRITDLISDQDRTRIQVPWNTVKSSATASSLFTNTVHFSGFQKWTWWHFLDRFPSSYRTKKSAAFYGLTSSHTWARWMILNQGTAFGLYLDYNIEQKKVPPKEARPKESRFTWEWAFNTNLAN